MNKVKEGILTGDMTWCLPVLILILREDQISGSGIWFLRRSAKPVTGQSGDREDMPEMFL
jgi:hypothetical protein